jgi:carboxyl-terminal processing protease
VDGKPTTTWSLTRAVDEITGPEGSVVELTVEREGEAEPMKFDLRRARIEIESVRGWDHLPGGGWDYLIDPEERIGYVRISQFIPSDGGGSGSGDRTDLGDGSRGRADPGPSVSTRAVC